MRYFEDASRLKFRFPFKGMITTEDLWDLSLEQLDTVYKALSKEAKASQEDSLLSDKRDVDTVLRAKISIVKYIFDYKKAEKEKRKQDAEKAEKKQRILEILAKKQDDNLMNSSEDELMRMLDDLG